MKSTYLLVFSLIAALIVVAGCSNNDLNTNPVSNTDMAGKVTVQNNGQMMNGPSNRLQVELARVRAATAKYQDVNQAIADGYADIDLYVPHMGWHYLNSGLLDANFDMEKPELLVYANKPDGGYQLVAVEYAVPLSLSPDAPEGFTGDEDVWEVNTQFQLWTLHAWVWYYNPDGMFSPFNPREQ